MDSYLASNYEILIKTESFLKFKKKLFKSFVEKNDEKEEFLRRKFYKILDCYLCTNDFNHKYFSDIKIDFVLKELNDKFKNKNEGSYLIQGTNVGYIKDGNIIWVRYDNKYKDKEIKTYLDET